MNNTLKVVIIYDDHENVSSLIDNYKSLNNKDTGELKDNAIVIGGKKFKKVSKSNSQKLLDTGLYNIENIINTSIIDIIKN